MEDLGEGELSKGSLAAVSLNREAAMSRLQRARQAFSEGQLVRATTSAPVDLGRLQRRLARAKLEVERCTEQEQALLLRTLSIDGGTGLQTVQTALDDFELQACLVGTLQPTGSFSLESQPANPPAEATEMARWALKKLVSNAFNDLDAPAWSRESRQLLRQFHADIDATGGRVSAGQARRILDEVEARLERLRGAQTRLPTPQAHAIPDSVQSDIVDQAAEGYRHWIRNRPTENVPGVSPLSDECALAACLLGAIDEQHTQGVQDAHALPSHDEINRLFHGLIAELLEDPILRLPEATRESLRDLRRVRLAPRMADTFEWLTKKFEEVPELRAIPSAQRWRLLVDPQLPQSLKEQGLPCTSPLLAFVFDAGGHDEVVYANRLAKAWWLALSSKDEQLRDALALELHEVLSGAGFATGAMNYGGWRSAEGMYEMGEFMEWLKQRGIDSRLHLGAEGEACAFDGKHAYKATVEQVGEIQASGVSVASMSRLVDVNAAASQWPN